MAGRLSKRPKFGPDEIVIATQGIAVGDFVIPRGTRLRGEHPVVRQVPQHFVPDGTPASEWPSMWASIPEPAQEPAPRPPIPDEEAAVAVEAFTYGNRHVPKGARLRRDDELVKAHPLLFRTPAMPVA